MQWRVEVHHINVGQGDSALILLYSIDDTAKETLKKAILIDAGKKNPGLERVLPYLEQVLKKQNKKLDAIVITHYDEDHVGGFFTRAGGGLLNDDTFKD